MLAIQTKALKTLATEHKLSLEDTIAWLRTLTTFRIVGGKHGCNVHALMANDANGQSCMLYTARWVNACKVMHDVVVAVATSR